MQYLNLVAIKNMTIDYYTGFLTYMLLAFLGARVIISGRSPERLKHPLLLGLSVLISLPLVFVLLSHLGPPSLMMTCCLLYTFSGGDLKTGWGVLLLACLCLYGSFFIPSLPYIYSYGYPNSYGCILLIVALALGWVNTRFMPLFITCLVAWFLELYPSKNFWDYCVDPYLFLASLFYAYGQLKTTLTHRSSENP